MAARPHPREPRRQARSTSREERATLAVMGPRARELLEPDLAATISATPAFPFAAAREIGIAGRARAGAAYHLCRRARLGAAHGERRRRRDLRCADERRREPRRRARRLSCDRVACASKRPIAPGAPTSPRTTIPSRRASGFAVSLRGDRDFLGRAALLAARDKPLKKRMASFVCDDEDVVLIGRETILRDGEPVGYLTSGGYGYTLQKPIGMGYVRTSRGRRRGLGAGGAIRAGRRRRAQAVPHQLRAAL